ncbi:hypothetical protein CEXT_802281 [Caerostris extrusa]|uniref:Uncharacterized protein n=1 Tax=Caerostris extrusa TaxID=172846 RepID=A0AAV4NXT2_CAEEX|nr:hypothetical protein CEXT_802281 [Caerostris extrusa]
MQPGPFVILLLLLGHTCFSTGKISETFSGATKKVADEGMENLSFLFICKCNVDAFYWKGFKDSDEIKDSDMFTHSKKRISSHLWKDFPITPITDHFNRHYIGKNLAKSSNLLNPNIPTIIVKLNINAPKIWMKSRNATWSFRNPSASLGAYRFTTGKISETFSRGNNKKVDDDEGMETWRILPSSSSNANAM